MRFGKHIQGKWQRQKQKKRGYKWKVSGHQTVILKAIDTAKAHLWDLTKPAFIPHFATWLRGERWEDECEVDLGTDVLVDGKIKQWHETWTGIVAKGEENGLKEEDFEDPQDFKRAVFKKCKPELKVA